MSEWVRIVSDARHQMFHFFCAKGHEWVQPYDQEFVPHYLNVCPECANGEGDSPQPASTDETE